MGGRASQYRHAKQYISPEAARISAWPELYTNNSAGKNISFVHLSNFLFGLCNLLDSCCGDLQGRFYSFNKLGMTSSCFHQL
jgi:hypothetical protein